MVTEQSSPLAQVLASRRQSTFVIKWVQSYKCPPWKLALAAREIRALCFGQDVSIVLVRRSTNDVADILAKIGVDREHESVFFF